MRLPLLALLFCLAVVLTINCGVAAPPASPNVIVILADDLGWSDLGCYGNPLIETPKLDAFAMRSLRFTQAYTAGSVCSPTRGSLMTGKVPARTGVTDYIPGLNPKGRLLNPPRTRTELPLSETTIGEVMRDGGYQTFYAGKWHLGGKGFEPQDQGFEVVIDDKSLRNAGRDWSVGKRLTDAACGFLEERDANRPFFMFLGYHEPHTPILEYPAFIKRFRDKYAALPESGVTTRVEGNGITRIVHDDPVYASEVAGLDAYVGRVLAEIDAAGEWDRTIVIFLSDNGGLSTKASPGPTSNEPLRAGKGWLYEGGIRVPMIVRVPGLTTENTVTDFPVLSTDLFPTIVSLTGVLPDGPLPPDGMDLSPVLGGNASVARSPLAWHYPHYHGSEWTPGGAIRDGDWKLIEFFEDQTVELYNVAADLSESSNVAAKHPAIVARLRTQLDQWRNDVGASVPPRRSTLNLTNE